MMVKDPFSYSARWDTVGVDCAYCVYFAGPPTWPDIQRSSHCGLHKVSLAIELGCNGYKEGEWFCRDFNDNGRAYDKAIEELEAVKESLQTNVLYGAYGPGGCLKEIEFENLK
jgi:hypothetical protein